MTKLSVSWGFSLMCNEETWVPVPGYEERYDISSHGRVRSVSRLVPSRFGLRRVNSKILTNQHWGAYPTLRLVDANLVPHQHDIHVLVALAFIGPRPTGEYVRHLDDNPRNNCLENLAYGTPAENQADMARNGRGTATKTRCIHGHPRTPENTYPTSQGYRACRDCKRNIYRRKTGKPLL
jgi:hypothetical protein